MRSLLLNKTNLIPICLTIAFLLIIKMSTDSAFSVHPDEYQHFVAARYYFTYWLPPLVGDPRTLDTYGPYGISYLDLPDIVYLIAGKFHNLLIFFEISSYQILRLFNVLLFLIICVVSFTSRNKIVLGVLLLSPQIWYIFSYFNADALPLFLTFLIVLLVSPKDGMFNKYIKGGHWAQGVLIGTLVGLLCISKINYLPFIIYIFLYLFIFLYYKRPLNSINIKKIILMIAIAATIPILRYSYDISVNGIDKVSKMLIFSNQVAIPGLKPFAPTYQNRITFKMKDHNISYPDLFRKFKWGEISFASMIGIYGGMNILADQWYYNLEGLLYLILMVYIIFHILKNYPTQDKQILFASVACSILVILISSYHSWTNDFQAQGRYLFPLYGIFAFLLGRNPQLFKTKTISIVIFLLVILSAYSFIFTGLAQLTSK